MSKIARLRPAAPAHRDRAGQSCLVALLLVALGAASAGAQGSGFLGIPRTIDGYPTNVGLLVLGHSTSAQGSYPAKLAAALEADALGLDGRHYQVVTAITGGDGGLLWSLLSVAPGDPRYERVRASAGGGTGQSPQWCEDAAELRWSCRRAKLEEVLTRTFPIPLTGDCAEGIAHCRAAALISCTWYDRTLPPGANPVTQSLSPHDCLARMDYRLALVQDTTNRSWPIDDFDRDGDVDLADRWPAARIRAEALPCGGGGVVEGIVDWDCDGAIGAADAPLEVYGDWLEALGLALVDAPSEAAVDFVFLGHKPLEMGQCELYPEPERATCLADPHAVRSAGEIASTPDRPFDHYYLPTVFWEGAALPALLSRPALNPRIQGATPNDPLAMWDRSVACYTAGLGADDWSIDATVPGRPTDVDADDTEVDDPPAPDSQTVGCMASDHIHHNDAGGWMMADVWYGGLAPRLFLGIFADGFESGAFGAWSAISP